MTNNFIYLQNNSSIQFQKINPILFFYINLIEARSMIDKIFGSICKENPQTLQKALIENQFQLISQKKIQKQIFAYLFDDCIVIKKQQQGLETQNIKTQGYFKIKFDYNLNFELITHKNIQKHKWNIQDCYSIKFYKQNKCFELKNQDHKINFDSWRKVLVSKLNQRGFHQLFQPIKEMGKGNFATVYLVQSNQNKTKHAIKAFSKEIAYAEENGKEALIKEIEIMKFFNHKNLMKIRAVYESVNSLYICVQLLSGGQLYDKIKAKHKFTSFEIKTIMSAILTGIAEMHSKNIMHRDLKPQNILLRSENDYDCVIADFGLAQKADIGQYLFVRCGTPGYVAPQLVNLKQNKKKYSVLCDLFSIGVIFHILIFGKSPFQGKTHDEVLEQNKVCRINFQLPQYQKIPDIWLDLLKKLMQKNPEKRISALQALQHDFFTKEPFLEKKQKENIEPFQKQQRLKSKINKLNFECDSPIMLTKSVSRKNKGLQGKDSCLKFKMKQNLIFKSESQEKKSDVQINSPLLASTKKEKKCESRFKKLAEGNS